MQYVQIARLILQLLPLIIAAVRDVEAAYPQSGQGPAKLAMVRGALEAAYQAGSAAEIAFAQLWPALAQIVAATVALDKTLK